jgi:hypothetical protein
MPRSIRGASLAALAFTIATGLAVASCGGSDSPDSPNNPSPPGGNPNPPPNPTATTTITITAAGVQPKDIIVTRGARVTFVNNNSVGHDMNSDPHPAHTACPELNVGFVGATQSRQTDVLNTARTCGYHDHNQPSNGALQGTITIQ